MPTRLKPAVLDKLILNRLQQGIPLTLEPWDSLSKELNIKEEQLIDRIVSLKKSGKIRRISAVFAPRKVGYASTLAAAQVLAKDIPVIVKKINAFAEVTHHYRRNAEFNLWFALVASDKERIAQILKQLRSDKNILKLLEFPTVKLFKINVNFNI